MALDPNHPAWRLALDAVNIVLLGIVAWVAFAQHRREAKAHEDEEARFEAFQLDVVQGAVTPDGRTPFGFRVRIVNLGRRDGCLKPVLKAYLAHKKGRREEYSALCMQATEPGPYLDEQTLQRAAEAAWNRPHTPVVPSGMPVEVTICTAVNGPLEPAQFIEVDIGPFVGKKTVLRLRTRDEPSRETIDRLRVGSGLPLRPT